MAGEHRSGAEERSPSGAVCGACGADNPAGFRFCGSCGTALGTPGCPSCGFVNPPGHHFCGRCGSRLGDDTASSNDTAAARSGPARTSSPGERKLATILFADVVGFTSMSENADPEAVARTVDAAFRRMAEVVEGYGGTVDKYLGDALMAVFGVPVAHDDDAERAVAAALAMRELGGDLAFSIGINSGEVMATAVGRDGDVTVIGDAVNVAARLEKAASGGEVLVGPLTAELAAAGIVFVERQPVILKGKRDPVPVFEVLGLRDGQPQAVERERPPLVGREDDLAFLRAQWRRVVRDQRASVVLVTADAGMGKTRLLEELEGEIADEAAVAHTRYPAYGGLGGPQVAKDIAERLGPMGEREVDVRVWSVAGEIDPSLSDLDPESFRHEQLWAYRRYLESKASEQPVLIVIDDIHRSGGETLDLLGALMARIVDAPIMLALVGRPGEWMTRFPGSTTVRLAPLSPADSEALVTAFMPAGAAPGDVAASLVQRGTGNPLYLRELVAVVCGREGAETLPPTLQAILAARLDALPPEQKGAIQRVSVLGDVAMEDQVAMLGLTQPGAALRSLVAAGLLRQRRDACYEVADPLLREVAYETLPRQVRGEWHRRAAQAVDEPVPRARQLERAAGYLPDDEDLRGEAAGALRDAGLGLLDGYRLNDGVVLLQQAVALGERTTAVLLRLASVLANAGRGEEALAALAGLDGQPLSELEEADRAHIETVTHMFRTPEDAVPALESAARRWAAVGRKDKQGWALSNMGVALFNSGHMTEAAAALERSLALFDESGETNGKLAAQAFLALIRPEDPRVTDWLGDGLRHAEKVGDRSGQANARILLAWHHTFRSYLGGPADIADADAYAQRALELASELHFAEFALHGHCLRARFARLNGRIDDAVASCTAAAGVEVPDDTGLAVLTRGVSFMVDVARDPAAPTPAATESPDPVAWMGWLAVAEGLILAGRVDEALALLDEFTLSSMSSLDGMTRGLLRAIALTITGRAAEARGFADTARGGAAAVRCRSGEQAAHALLAEHEARDGDGAAAGAHLAEVGTTAPDSVAGVLALRARAVLGQDGGEEQLWLAAEHLAAPGLLLGMT
ncbi:MAG: AAA family ATPase [Acidimicrobiia bacterium]|nr:AAA family ATPase [Acidimicrobiia bacterium]